MVWDYLTISSWQVERVITVGPETKEVTQDARDSFGQLQLTEDCLWPYDRRVQTLPML